MTNTDKFEDPEKLPEDHHEAADAPAPSNDSTEASEKLASTEEASAESDSSTPARKRRIPMPYKIAIAATVVLAAVLIGFHAGIIPDPAQAGRDAGGFAGSSDYGGGGGYSGGGYSGGGYSGGGYSGGGGYSSSGSSGSGSTLFDLIVIAVIAIFWIVAKTSGRKAKPHAPTTSRKQQHAGASRTAQSKLKPVSELQERDPLFSATAVEEMVANVYVRMQEAWTAGDFEPMRPYFSNALFSQFSNQLSALTKKGWVNYVERIAVLETHVRGWYETDGFEYLVMKVRTRIVDYTMDKDGRVVSGFTDAESYMEYEYTLQRSAGTLTTGQTRQTEAGECPNCGAPINLAQNARCSFCGSVIESDRFTWVISAIKGISQQIAH